MTEKRQTLKVAGLGNLSLLESHRAYLAKLGDGNMSEGVRRMIERDKAAALLAQDYFSPSENGRALERYGLEFLQLFAPERFVSDAKPL